MAANARTSEANLWIPDISSALPLPPGWSEVANARVPTVRGPEGDVEMGFVVMPMAPSDTDIAAAAWRSLEAPPALEVMQDQELPVKGGWERARQIVYRVPGRDEAIAIALLRMLGGRAHVTLIVGAKAALDRRMAQLMQLIEGWRPDGLQAEDLSGREPGAWGPREREAMGDFVREAMEALGIPGVAMAVVQGGRIVDCRGFGRCGVDAPEPVTGDTRFMIGSATKPLTSLMMARLIGKGCFAWSTPVVQLMPDFALADAAMTRRLQMRHTVSASTGMPRNDMELAFQVDGHDPTRCLARMKLLQPTTRFGETFQYCNQLVALGGYAAAAAYAPKRGLAAAYRKVMREQVFVPLGMRRTLLQRPRSTFALAHAPDLEGVTRPIDMSLETFAEPVAPAGAVWSTARDMARYLQMELAGGQDAQGATFLARDLLQQRYEAQIRIGSRSSYGLGLFRADESGLDVLGHGGNTMGFSADMSFLPEQDLGMVMLTNRAMTNDFLAAARQKVRELLFGAEEKSGELISLAVRARQAATSNACKRIRTDAPAQAWIANLAGTYVSNRLGSAQVRRNGHSYQVQFDAWSSSLAAETSNDGCRQLALISPPWSGNFLLRVEDGGNTLVCSSGQEQHAFRRQSA